MVAELLVERVELLARGRTHNAGDAEIAPLAARAHLDGRRIEVRSVLHDDLGHGLGEPRLFWAHHLDREIARERERRAVGDYGHARQPFRRAATRAGPRASPCA